MLAVSGVLASSAMGWPSIFYFSGAAGLVWSILYFFYGSSSPSDCSDRISPEEKRFIEASLNTGDHGSKVTFHYGDIETVLTESSFLAREDTMEITFHFTTRHRFDHRSLGAQLGLLDYSHRNSVVHEERLALQYQTKRSLICTSVFCDDVHEFDFESARRLAG